jgi:hypothetical protein
MGNEHPNWSEIWALVYAVIEAAEKNGVRFGDNHAQSELVQHDMFHALNNHMAAHGWMRMVACRGDTEQVAQDAVSEAR